MLKHEKISKALRAEIAGGRYDRSGKLPSEAQLVSKFGVSRPTVARALRDLQEEGIVERRAGSGTYIRSGDDEKRANVLGLLVPDRAKTEVFEAISGELGALAKGEGYGLLWGDSDNPYGDRDASAEHALGVCRRYIEKRVAGVFFAPLEFSAERDAVNREILELLRQAGIPVVLIDRDIGVYPKRSECDLVSIDNFGAGFLLGEHLIRLGCKRLLFVSRRDSAGTVQARVCGVREALAKYELAIPAVLNVEGDPTSKTFVKKMGAGKKCDGIICANDLTAAELMKTLDGIGVKVPGEVRVVGFDDVRYATLLSVALTTIHQPCRDLAEVAFRAMQERLREPLMPARTMMLAPRLVVRESCGAYRL